VKDIVPVRTLCVDPLLAFGQALWLQALALGASAVALVDDAGLTVASRSLLQDQVRQIGLMLGAQGAQRIAFLPAESLAKWVKAVTASHPAVADRPDAATKALPFGKRQAELKALELWALGHPMGADIVSLPAKTSFGAVLVNKARCTLCMACTNLCPTGALQSDEDGAPRLNFTEDACVQCGLCDRGCPEKAISLVPRYLPQASARGVARVLNEDDLAPCTSCGTPFISRRLLAASLAHIEGHQVLAKGGRERLMTCPSCRQQAVIQT
jgi:ferredoxin